MSHLRQSSMASIATISSTLSDEFHRSVQENIDNSRRSTASFVEAAEGQIQWLFMRNDRMLTDCHNLDSALILKAMLQFSSLCGGERGKRYTACAIVTCDYIHAEQTLLVDLARTWLTYFLWTFKAAGYSKSEHPSEHATPRKDDVASRITSAPGSRDRLTNTLRERDGNRCAITKYRSVDFPANSDEPYVHTEGVHIIRRSLAVFPDHKLEEFAITRIIMQNYADLPEEMLEQLDRVIDDPQNGMTLQQDWHTDFYQFHWCLLPQEENNTYKIKRFGPPLALRPPSDIVVFQDHSNKNIPLPNPKFLALHAAIAHVLYMSGAGEAIDKLLNQFGDLSLAVPSSRPKDPRDLAAMVAAMHLIGGLA